MHKLNVFAIAALLAGAAVLGMSALRHTVSLGAAHRSSADAVVRKREQQLNRFESALRRELARKTPALPAVPKVTAARPAAAPPVQRVVYRRPPAIVVVKHRAPGDDGHETEGGGDD